jgi:hypothetical protein
VRTISGLSLLLAFIFSFNPPILFIII